MTESRGTSILLENRTTQTVKSKHHIQEAQVDPSRQADESPATVMLSNHDSQVTATQLKNAAQSSLDAYNYENGIFLCERSLAEQDSEVTRCLLAKCHYLNRNLTAAYGVLENPEPQSVNGLWLRARVCWDMEKWHEAEDQLGCVVALLNEQERTNNETSVPTVSKAEVLFLLGEVANRTNRVQKAIKAYSEALELNPFMWKCCERLADLGAWQSIDGKLTDSAAQQHYSKRSRTDEPPAKPRTPLVTKTTAGINTTPAAAIHATPPNIHSSASNAAENLFRHDRSGQRSSRKGAPFSGDNTTAKSLSYIMKIFRTLADGYSKVSKCACKEGIVILRSLPKIHVNTAWVQRLIAKCYYERGEYSVSAQTYEYARRLAPYAHEGMDLYSTVLWQLRDTKELSGLSHQLTADNKRSAIAWCVVGNAFSLQKDHESAQVFFERAIQLDPHYLYAYTLLGMEYEAIDAFDKAKACYLKAARISPRYYNVWNALGQSFLREESYARATSCFMKAHELNANSSIIACNLGNVYLAQKQYLVALNKFDLALSIDSKNAVATYYKGKVLNFLGRCEEALVLLLNLMDVAPGEAKIYYLISKIYRELERTNDAAMYLRWARDLDPQSASRPIDSDDDDVADNDIVEDDHP